LADLSPQFPPFTRYHNQQLPQAQNFRLTMCASVILLPLLLQFLAVPSSALTTRPLNLLTVGNRIRPFNLTENGYHVECVKITEPPQIGLNPTMCEAAVPIACGKLNFPQPERLVRDKWIWIEMPGCALGYYLPAEPMPGRIPSKAQCEENIFGAIVEKCGTNSRFNAGNINVDDMPSFSGDGLPLTPGYPRYVMAAERMTL